MRSLTLSLGCLILSSACLAQPLNWVQVKTKNSPPGLWSHGTAYDLVRGVTTIFGGSSSASAYTNDTWEYDGSNWGQINPKTKPPVRRLHTLVHHLAGGKTILFGGLNTGSVIYSDTWLWDGKDWTQAKPKNSPPGRYIAAMAYDSARQRTVLFGGQGASARFNDTWEWDGTNWTQIQTKNSPSARYTSIAYDAARKRIVLFGGFTGSYVSDTWEYDGTDWTQMKPTTSPPARCCHAMAYDTARQRTVIFSGFTPNLNDTWEYDGTTWVEIKTATRPAERRDFDALVFDQKRKRMVFYGGLTTTQSNETWEYRPSPTLLGSPSVIDLAAGGTHAFTLDAGKPNAGRLYWILGSVTGTSPGVTLASTVGSVTIPLNPDPYTDITIALANSPLLAKTRGTLDASGQASAALNVPKVNFASVIDVTLYHAYLVYDAKNNYYWASNPATLQLFAAPNGITVETNGTNSFNAVTTSGFFSVTNSGNEVITEITFDWVGATGQGTMVFDCDQTGMADIFWLGNGSGTSPCRGTYRNGSDTATGLVYDASNTFKQTCGGKTYNCGFIATNLTGNSAKTVRFRFSGGKFNKGKKFEVDADTDGGAGINGGSMAGMKITIKTASNKTLTGTLQKVSNTVSRKRF